MCAMLRARSMWGNLLSEMMSWIPTSKVLGSKRHRPAVLSPDVFSDGLYTGGESFWSRLSGSSAEWLRKFGFYKK